MDENKNEILEEGTESLPEEMEEVVEETVEEAVEEITEEAEEEVEDSTEAEKYIDTGLLLDEVADLRMENEALKKTNKTLKGILTAIVAVVVAVALVFGGTKLYKTVYNSYNHMGYYNTSGLSLADVAELNDMTVEEVIDMLGIPEDVKPDTYYDVLEFLIPVSHMAEMYGIDVETMKEAFGFGEEITGSSTWGEALDTMTLLNYWGSEERVEEFKAEYGFGDEVTSETLWGEIRAKANKIDYEKSLAEKATEVVADEGEDNVENTVEDVTENVTETVE